MALPICFLTQSAAGVSLPSEGMTRDVSPGGLRFDVDLPQPPPLHSEIAACIFVPPHARAPESSVFLSGRATILRCTPIGPRLGHRTGTRWSVAARFDTHPVICLPALGILDACSGKRWATYLAW
jgi:hypothetical protein